MYGHLMTNPAIVDKEGHEIPEGILDGGANHAVRAARSQEQAEFTYRLDLHRQAERCTARPKSVSLVRCFRADRRSAEAAAQYDQDGHHGRGAPHQRQPHGVYRARPSRARRLHQHRVSRSHRRRDSIRAMEAGPMTTQGRYEVKRAGSPRTSAPTCWSVSRAGLRGRAQIGKGMWAMPDLMHAMLEQKIAHPKAGANTRMGALAHRRNAACAALLTKSTCRRCRRRLERTSTEREFARRTARRVC